MTHEISGSHLANLKKALQKLGLLERVVARLPTAAANAIADPGRLGWWPGSLSQDILLGVREVGGLEAVERLGSANVEVGAGPIVMPLVKVLLALGGSKPSSFFGRIAQFSSTSERGTKITWADLDDKHGKITVEYPDPVDEVVLTVWRGGISKGFDVLSRSGRVDSATRSADGRTLTFLLSWE